MEAEKGSYDKSSHPSYSRGLKEASNKKCIHGLSSLILASSWISPHQKSEHLLIRKPAASSPLTLCHWRFTLGRHGRLFSLRREKWGRIGSSKRILLLLLLVCFRFSQYFWVTRGTVSPPPNSNTNKLATSWNISLEPKPTCAPIPRGGGGPHGNYVPPSLKMWSCQRAFSHDVKGQPPEIYPKQGTETSALLGTSLWPSHCLNWEKSVLFPSLSPFLTRTERAMAMSSQTRRQNANPRPVWLLSWPVA